MSPRELVREALALAGAATPGPWVRACRGGEQSHDAIWNDDITTEQRIALIEQTDNHPGDAPFITRARVLVPDLAQALLTALDELDALRAER